MVDGDVDVNALLMPGGLPPWSLSLINVRLFGNLALSPLRDAFRLAFLVLLGGLSFMSDVGDGDVFWELAFRCKLLGLIARPSGSCLFREGIPNALSSHSSTENSIVIPFKTEGSDISFLSPQARSCKLMRIPMILFKFEAVLGTGL